MRGPRSSVPRSGNGQEDSALPETEEEHIEMLLEREGSLVCRSYDHPFDWLGCTRFDVLGWIKMIAYFCNLGGRTTYRTVAYLDRFLLRHRHLNERQEWVVRLSAIACILLAAKMEGVKPPALSDLRTEKAYEFKRKEVQRMELSVLQSLDWRMSLVTPFEYLNYFASRLGYDLGADDRLSTAKWCILYFAEVNFVACYRPSTVAIAAVLAACDRELTKRSVESKMAQLHLPGPSEVKKASSRYAEMVQGMREEAESVGQSPSFDNPTNGQSRKGKSVVVDTSSASSSNTRRR